MLLKRLNWLIMNNQNFCFSAFLGKTFRRFASLWLWWLRIWWDGAAKKLKTSGTIYHGRNIASKCGHCITRIHSASHGTNGIKNGFGKESWSVSQPWSTTCTGKINNRTLIKHIKRHIHLHILNVNAIRIICIIICHIGLYKKFYYYYQ